MNRPIRMDQYRLYEVGGEQLLETYTIVEGARFDLNPAVRPPGFPFGYEWRLINADGDLVRILTARWVES